MFLFSYKTGRKLEIMKKNDDNNNNNNNCVAVLYGCCYSTKQKKKKRGHLTDRILFFGRIIRLNEGIERAWRKTSIYSKYMLADDGAFLCGLAYVQDVGGKRSAAPGDAQYTTGVGGYSALNSD